MAEMVFNWSLGPLIVGALLPPILLSFFIAATNRGASFSASVDRFIDLCLYFVMQFTCPPQQFSFYTQIIISVIMLCIFLVTNILRDEVISFSKRDRIPESGCHFSRCETLMASAVFGYDNDYKPTQSDILDFYLPANATSVRRADIAVCKAHENPRAIFTTSFLPMSELAVLLSHGGLCGRRDILELRSFSFKQQGLLLEENLMITNNSVELCLAHHMPWLERIATEHGLLKFTHNSVSQGKRIPENVRERMLWNAEPRLFMYHYPDYRKRISMLQNGLVRVRNKLRISFRENNMWEEENLAPWPLKSLNIAFAGLAIGVSLASVILLLKDVPKMSRIFGDREQTQRNSRLRASRFVKQARRNDPWNVGLRASTFVKQARRIERKRGRQNLRFRASNSAGQLPRPASLTMVSPGKCENPRHKWGGTNSHVTRSKL